MLTNREVRLMFEGMIEKWFSESIPAYNDFIRAERVNPRINNCQSHKNMGLANFFTDTF